MFEQRLSAKPCSIGHRTRRLKAAEPWVAAPTARQRLDGAPGYTQSRPFHLATPILFFGSLALPNPASLWLLIPRLGFFRGQMLLELFYLRSNHQLTVSLGRILSEIVLVIVFGRIEMF
jgi:hypothetical protein